MAYKKVEELPKNVREVLPEHAQHIYFEAFNNAWDQYADPEKRRGRQSREEVSHKVAWAAVKKEYKKGPDGKWIRR